MFRIEYKLCRNTMNVSASISMVDRLNDSSESWSIAWQSKCRGCEALDNGEVVQVVGQIAVVIVRTQTSKQNLVLLYSLPLGAVACKPG